MRLAKKPRIRNKDYVRPVGSNLLSLRSGLLVREVLHKKSFAAHKSGGRPAFLTLSLLNLLDAFHVEAIPLRSRIDCDQLRVRKAGLPRSYAQEKPFVQSPLAKASKPRQSQELRAIILLPVYLSRSSLLPRSCHHHAKQHGN